MKAKRLQIVMTTLFLSAAGFTCAFAAAPAVETAYAAEIDTQEDATPGEPEEDTQVTATAGNAVPPVTTAKSTGHYDRSYKTGERFPYLMWFAAGAALCGLTATAFAVRHIKNRKEREIRGLLK